MNRSTQPPTHLPACCSSRWHSLRWRILISLGLLLLTTLFITGVGVAYFVFLTERDAWQSRQAEATQNAAETVADFLEHTQDSLTIVSMLDRDYLTAQPQVMNDLLLQNQALLEIVRLDANGHVFAKASKDKPVLENSFTIAQSDWFQVAAAGKSYLGKIHISADNEPYLITAIPAPDDGVVAARLQMRVLWDAVATIQFGRTGRAYVVDRTGRIVAHTDPNVVLANRSIAGRSELVTLLQTHNYDWSGTYVNFKEAKVVGTSSLVRGTDWLVITELSQAEAYAVTRMALYLLGSWMLIFGILVMRLTIQVLERVIFRPLEKLRAGAERFGQGDLSYRIALDRQDEVGRVAEDFNAMAARLHKRDEQLAQILEVGNTLQRNLNLSSLLQEIVRSVHQGLEFGAVVLNLVDEDIKKVRVCAHAGLDDLGQNLLEDAVYPWEEFSNLLQERFRVGSCYFVPHDEFNWARDFKGPVHIPPDAGQNGHGLDNRWHPNDALFVPIEIRPGQIAGIISVDQPLDGQRPDLQTFQALEIFANQAAAAIENARLYDKGQQELNERRRAEVALREAHDELESRVQERTAALAEANQSLQAEIGERERAETALSEERNLLRTLIDNLPDFIFVKDAESRFVINNAAHQRGLRATTQEELVGKTDFDIFPQDLAESYHADEQKVIRSGNPLVDREEPYLDLEGNTKWLSTIKVPLRDSQGKIVGLVGMSRDVTERKQSEEALKTYAAKLEQSNNNLAQRNRQLLALQAAGAAMASSLNLEHVLNTLTREMTHLLEMEACAISEWNRVADTVSTLFEHGLDEWRDERSQPEVFVLTDFPLTKGVLVERCVQHLTIGQSDLDSAEKAYMKADRINTLLMLPMIFQDRVVGLVEVMDRAEQMLTDQQISLAQMLANQAASAIENARLYQEMHQYLGELTALNTISQTINSTLDLQKILAIITEHTNQLLGVEATSVALYDSAQEDLWMVAAGGGSSSLIQDRRLALNQGIMGWVFQNDEPVIISDVTNDPRFYSDFDRESTFTTRSVMCSPLRTKGETIGVIEVINKLSRAFDQEDLRLLSSLAAPAAIAIENARLYEHAQREIIERKRAEEVLKTYTTKLEQSNRELQDFAYVASHDLQEPLRKVRAFGDRLRAKHGEALGDQGQDYLTRMQNAAARMQTLIQDLLSFSRVTTRAKPFEPVDLTQVARAVVSDLEIPLEQTGGRVEVGALPTIEADPTQMRQMFQNLVSNAIKFRREAVDPIVEIQARYLNGQSEIPAESVPHSGTCQILVTDNGIGFDEKYLDRIFQVFQRLHNRTEFEGTGIGLAICRKIVERHGGTITAESTPGQGATFIVNLPLIRPPD